MTDSLARTFIITLVIGLLLLFARAAWLDGLGALGEQGVRTALDVEISREWIAMTGSLTVPQRMPIQ